MKINVKMLVNRQGPAGVIYAAGSSYDIEETLAHRFVSSNAALYTAGSMPFEDGGVPVMAETNPVTGGIELSAGGESPITTTFDDLFIAFLGDSHTNGKMEYATVSSGFQTLANLPGVSADDYVWDGAANYSFFRADTQINSLTGCRDSNSSLSTDKQSYCSLVPGHIRASKLCKKITIANFGVGGASSYTWAGEQAYGYISAVANANNGDTFTVDGVVYTFKTTPAAAYDVQIGASANASGANLANAINLEGSGYISAGMVIHPTCFCPTPTAAANIKVQAKASGTTGNALVISSSTTARMSSADGFLAVGSPKNLINGAVTSALYVNAKAKMPGIVPFAFVITLGTNDAIRPGFRGVGTQAELNKLIADIKADYPTSKIVFVKPIQTSAGGLTDSKFTSTVIPAINQVLTDNPTVKAVDMTTLGTGGTGNFRITSGDGVHGSNYAYWVLASLAAKQIVS